MGFGELGQGHRSSEIWRWPPPPTKKVVEGLDITDTLNWRFLRHASPSFRVCRGGCLLDHHWDSFGLISVENWGIYDLAGVLGISKGNRASTLMNLLGIALIKSGSE